MHCRGILKSKTAYLLGSFVAIAYAISYVLLQMEHFALLGGTLVLFICLIIVMYLTKDTGSLFRQMSKESEAASVGESENSEQTGI